MRLMGLQAFRERSSKTRNPTHPATRLEAPELACCDVASQVRTIRSHMYIYTCIGIHSPIYIYNTYTQIVNESRCIPDCVPRRLRPPDPLLGSLRAAMNGQHFPVASTCLAWAWAQAPLAEGEPCALRKADKQISVYVHQNTANITNIFMVYTPNALEPTPKCLAPQYPE
jgi:hypothetical protein